MLDIMRDIVLLQEMLIDAVAINANHLTVTENKVGMAFPSQDTEIAMMRDFAKDISANIEDISDSLGMLQRPT